MNLELFSRLEEMLAEISGLPHVSLQPAAGAHGELASLMMIKARCRKGGERERDVVLIPASAHGTTPSSCTIASASARNSNLVATMPPAALDSDSTKLNVHIIMDDDNLCVLYLIVAAKRCRRMA